MPTPAQLISEYVRRTPQAGGVMLIVARLSWPDSHRYELSWHDYRFWPEDPGPEAVLRAAHDLLADSRYFRRCQRCRQLEHVDCMARERCFPCAERLGVVF